MPPLRSRTGCAPCKRRKIKCGEERPSCSNCTSYRDTCIYVASHDSRRSPRDDRLSAASTPQPTPQAQPAHARTIEESAYLTDLALLHHFCTSTYLGISNSPTVHRLMQGPVVHLALEHPFLRYSILALAALHKVHLTSGATESEENKHFRRISTTYHNIALRTLLDSNTSLEAAVQASPSAAFCFTTITSIYSLASIEPLSESGMSQENTLYLLTHWIKLTHGNTSILATKDVYDRVRNGPLADIFTGHTDPKDWSLPGDINAALEAAKCWSGNGHTGEDVEALEAALDLLKLVYFKFSESYKNPFPLNLASETGIVFSWPARVSVRYLELLENRDPRALVVLAYFLVPLHWMSARYWWVGERASFLLTLLVSLIKTHPLRARIEWAKAQISPKLVVDK
ncbi:hypothetical protein FH972_023698 [Carpinus fangiana]|uniref:Zn(2)-C6 fungal-type domain-containing protein n=1 Tax=Carpinus fangiana TaxID=176857 RepID=A0A5N6KWB6_9ROSI|nr:hypothetical protein FH972_023698 [Carpinus fangiana]